MNSFQIFVIRAVLGMAFGVLFSRIFFQNINIASVMSIGIFLVGMAYVLEYFKNRKKD